MRWKKLGIVYNSTGREEWQTSHAQVPTPYLLNEDVLRLFYTAWDSQGRGRPTYVDVDAADPMRVIAPAGRPLMDFGRPGAFDDNGLILCSLVANDDGTLLMYYAGFQLFTKIRYTLLAGLAISRDNGESFVRHSLCPILERSDEELFLRAGPCVLRDEGLYKMWYVSGASWKMIQGREMPVYDIRYLESADGFRWPSTGKQVMTASREDEYGFGRPWVLKKPEGYAMTYCIRRISFNKHRLGYAESVDGLNWRRADEALNLDVGPAPYDSDTMMSSAVITLRGRTYCFYNGNDFGRTGIAAALLETA